MRVQDSDVYLNQQAGRLLETYKKSQDISAMAQERINIIQFLKKMNNASV